ncbi:hypothetical protein F4778DRAFT_91597 [Xylariomycetidae sp. FL2044]|nr:hypothetical protein F4778DRAFT_91597 [Xylariomycetidae sp. FL2044]
MAAPDKTFSCFPNLPIELRLMIWRACLPHRVVELDWQFPSLLFEPACFKNDRITSHNAAPPLIAQVCRESRVVALENGAPLSKSVPLHERDAEDFVSHMVRESWFDPERSSIHLNWQPLADIKYQTYNWGDPARCVLWHAARTRSRRPSIVLAMLREFRLHEPRWSLKELAGILRNVEDLTIVLTLPVVVHAGPKQAAGFFGLLSDAPVQLVDLCDESRIRQFVTLGGTANTSTADDLIPNLVAEGLAEVQETVDTVFGKEEPRPTIHPAVMFRLCDRACI